MDRGQNSPMAARVFVPYVSSDAHTGTQTTSISISGRRSSTSAATSTSPSSTTSTPPSRPLLTRRACCSPAAAPAASAPAAVGVGAAARAGQGAPIAGLFFSVNASDGRWAPPSDWRTTTNRPGPPPSCRAAGPRTQFARRRSTGAAARACSTRPQIAVLSREQFDSYQSSQHGCRGEDGARGEYVLFWQSGAARQPGGAQAERWSARRPRPLRWPLLCRRPRRSPTRAGAS